jgi:hypothetical protein
MHHFEPAYIIGAFVAIFVGRFLKLLPYVGRAH